MGFPIEPEIEIEESGAPGHSGHSGAVERAEAENGAVAPVRLGIGRWSRWIAVAGGFGYVPVAPGTAGAFAGVLLFLLIVSVGTGFSQSGFAALYALVVVTLLVLGIRAAGRAEVDFGRRDDGRIVIDEVVGQLISLVPMVFLAPVSLLASENLFLFFLDLVTGFVLFRLFDVWKPGAIRWTERRFDGGLGVMADDAVAGLHAALGLLALHVLVFERFLTSSLASLAFSSASLRVSA